MPSRLFRATEPIRNAEALSLVDSDALERVLASCGICIPLVNQKELPLHWQQKSSPSAECLQCPNQLSSYLIWIAQVARIKSYVELGVSQGGLFAITMEYLRRLELPLTTALAIDKSIPSDVKDYCGEIQGCSWIEGDTRDVSFPPADLYFIDADHTYKGVHGDFLRASSVARRIAFHDIVDWNCPGVRQLWVELKRSAISDAVEFIDQPSPKQERVMMGIGVIDIFRMS